MKLTFTVRITFITKDPSKNRVRTRSRVLKSMVSYQELASMMEAIYIEMINHYNHLFGKEEQPNIERTDTSLRLVSDHLALAIDNTMIEQRIKLIHVSEVSE